MSLIKPFAGLRPAGGRAAEIAAPPYDVMSEREARRMVEGRPWSFLHISRPEIDLPEGTDPYAPEVYAKARANLDHLVSTGILTRDPSPRYYAYRLTMGQHRQTGLVAAASVQAYETNRIKKHELTRQAKEDDRVRQIEALGAQTGPVLLVYRAQAEIDAALARLSAAPPEVDITAPDGVRHELWCITQPSDIDALTQAFDGLDALYVADGHHRSAAAARVAAARRRVSHAPAPDDAFLCVIFPHDQMQILDYNRVARDLNGHDIDAFIARIRDRFAVEPCEQPVKPVATAEYGMYLQGRWYRLSLHPELIPNDDPVAKLDVSLLQNHLIGPILDINDPRRDERIDFLGGIRGIQGLIERVDSGEMTVAFALHPTGMDELMAVADAGEIMPPKSTWFEPKLADGLVSLVLDRTDA